MNKTFRAPVMVAALIALSSCGVFKGGGPKKTPTVGQRVPILASENEVATDPAMTQMQVTLPAPFANDAWAQPGGNAAKSMGQLALAEAPGRAWQATINGGSDRERVRHPPGIAHGNAFVIVTDSTVHVINDSLALSTRHGQ